MPAALSGYTENPKVRGPPDLPSPERDSAQSFCMHCPIVYVKEKQRTMCLQGASRHHVASVQSYFLVSVVYIFKWPKREK